MSIATQSAPAFALPPPVPLRRFTVAEYHMMIQAGVFASDERFELLEGWIVAKMTRNPPHDVAIELLCERLNSLVPAGWRVRSQCAITTADSEPEPDVALVRGAPRDYLSHHPGPADLALVVEVAESTIADDRTFKGRLYARAGIPVYWIVNLVEHRVEVYSDPTGPDPNPRYRDRHDFGGDAAVALLIAGQERAQLPIRDILP